MFRATRTVGQDLAHCKHSLGSNGLQSTGRASNVIQSCTYSSFCWPSHAPLCFAHHVMILFLSRLLARSLQNLHQRFGGRLAGQRCHEVTSKNENAWNAQKGAENRLKNKREQQMKPTTQGQKTQQRLRVQKLYIGNKHVGKKRRHSNLFFQPVHFSHPPWPTIVFTDLAVYFSICLCSNGRPLYMNAFFPRIFFVSFPFAYPLGQVEAVHAANNQGKGWPQTLRTYNFEGNKQEPGPNASCAIIPAMKHFVPQPGNNLQQFRTIHGPVGKQLGPCIIEGRQPKQFPSDIWRNIPKPLLEENALFTKEGLGNMSPRTSRFTCRDKVYQT